MESIRAGTLWAALLDFVRQQDATDLHCQAQKPYRIRVHGELRIVPASEFPIPNNEVIYEQARQSFSPALAEAIEQKREVDVSFWYGPYRFRVNFSKQTGGQSFSFRTVPQHRLRFKDLQLPESLKGILGQPRGLVLATGPTGQGKSTTMRALLQQLNETRAVRIISIEDPIEYMFEDVLAQFEQREVGIDTDTFENGIRNAMRQDPNVLFVGEIRDRASIYACMQAAETGHLVLTTLHADSTAQAIARIREFYPTDEQENISSLLARNVNAIICQRLLPNRRGTRTPCLEIMRRDGGVEEAIRKNELEMLTGIVESAVTQGMHSFDQYLMELLGANVITPETARLYAVNPHRLDLRLRGIEMSQPILKPDADRL